MDLHAELPTLYARVRVDALRQRKFPPEAFWDAVLPIVESSPDLTVEEVGRSALGRPLRLVRSGGGPTRVLLWSQMPGAEPYRADVGINFDVSLDLTGGKLADVGDLSAYSGRDILVAEGMYLHPGPETLEMDGDRAPLEVKRPATLTIRRGPEPDSPAVWTLREGVAARADAP